MAMPTVRNIIEELHRTLRVQAAPRGHSMEAQVRRSSSPQSARTHG